MSEKGANRGIRGLLSAASIADCPIPFNCSPQVFENRNGSKTVMEIKDGKCISRHIPVKTHKAKKKEGSVKASTETKQEQEPEPEQKDESIELNNQQDEVPTETEETSPQDNSVPAKQEATSTNTDTNTPQEAPGQESSAGEKTDEEVEYDRKFVVSNSSIDGAEDDSFASDIVKITDYFKENVCTLFDAQILDIKLEFGVKDEGHVIHLLSGSVTTTVNGFTKNLMKDEAEFTEFLTNELATPPNTSKRCATGSSSCLKADYKVPRIFVILHRAHQKFPNVDEARLYRIIKSRIQAINPDVSKQLTNVCIACTHVYTAQQRKYQGQKETNQLPRYVDPPLFESLSPAELSLKGKRDVGETRDCHKPFCYMINVTDSPYRSSVAAPKAPPKPPARSPPGKIPKGEKWVDRLANGNASHSVRVLNEEDGAAKAFVPNEPLPELDPIVPNKSYSEKLAPKTYTKTPFGYSFIDKMKQRANRNLRKSQIARK